MSIPNSAYWAVVPAAGVGRRMGGDVPKQYLRLRGRAILEHTLCRLASHPRISGIVVSVSADDALWPSIQLPSQLPVYQVVGGAERCHSVLNALELLAQHALAEDWVLVHDAARPCLRLEDIDRLMATLKEHPVGGLLGTPIADTVKRTDASGNIQSTVNRDGLWRALTPQMFRFARLREALTLAVQAENLVTDEAAAMERLGLAPRLVEGHPDNLKITRPGDLAMAEFFMQLQEQGMGE